MRLGIHACLTGLLLLAGCAADVVKGVGDAGRVPGKCVPSAEICNDIDDNCDGTIDEGFDLAADPNHCGSCGRVCGSGQKCQEGHCARVQPASDCTPTNEVCNGKDDDCDGVIDNDIDLRRDSSNCGICGRRCASGEWCAEGHCSRQTDLNTCVSSKEVCNGKDDDCNGKVDDGFNLLNDINNCGICQRQCEPDATCVNGRCTLTQVPSLCLPQSESCNGQDDNCDGQVDEDFDLLSDHANCGICGRMCSTSQQCVNGRCQETTQVTTCVPAGESCNNRDDDCDGQVDEDFDLLSDNANCGICGRQCANGQMCRNGRCTNVVVSSTCQPQVEACNNVDDDCDGVIDNGFDLLSDRTNCGVCGRSCGAGYLCENGRCKSTTPVTNCTPAAEVCNNVDDNCDGIVDEGFDLLSDPDNCGGCGTVCEGGYACIGGHCSADAHTQTSAGTTTYVLQPDVIVLPPEVQVIPAGTDPCDAGELVVPDSVSLSRLAAGLVIVGGTPHVACRLTDVSPMPAAPSFSRQQSIGDKHFWFHSTHSSLLDVFSFLRVDLDVGFDVTPGVKNIDMNKFTNYGWKMEGDIGVRLQGGVHVDIEIRRGVPVLFELSYSFSRTPQIDVRLWATLSEFSIPLVGDIPLGAVVLGPVEITFSTNLDLELGADVQSAGVRLQSECRHDYVGSIRWATGEALSIAPFQQNDRGCSLQVAAVDSDVGNSIEVYVVPQFNIKFYDVAGPSFQLKRGLKLSLNRPPSPAPLHLDLARCTKLGVDARLEFMGLELEKALGEKEWCAPPASIPIGDCGGGACCDTSSFPYAFKAAHLPCGSTQTRYTCLAGTACGADISVQTRSSGSCPGTSATCTGAPSAWTTTNAIACSSSQQCVEGTSTCGTCQSDACAGVTCSGHGSCSGGACTCSTGYTGSSCSQCASGYTGYPTCTPQSTCTSSGCSGHGTCSSGSCTCSAGYDGAACDQCASGYTGYPGCTPQSTCTSSTCSGHGTCGGGSCSCNTGYAGAACDQCASGYTGYPTCTPQSTCTSSTCSGHGGCNGNACQCNTGYTGGACDQCASGYTGYPACQPDPCAGNSCSGHGTCNGGACSCNTGYTGASCNACAPGYSGYPSCGATSSCNTICSNYDCGTHSGCDCGSSCPFAGEYCDSSGFCALCSKTSGNCDVTLSAASALLYSGNSSVSTVADCSTLSTPGWHSGPGTSNIRWTWTSGCAKPLTSSPTVYGAENARWTLTVPVDGYYSIEAFVPSSSNICGGATTRYAAKVYYALVRTGEDTLLAGPLNPVLNTNNWMGVWPSFNTVHLNAGQHTLIMYDRSDDSAAGCSQTSSKWVFADQIRVKWDRSQ